MLNGLDILIARMKTNPEEFMRNGKWADLILNVDKHLTEEERQALKQGYTDMARDAFNEVVLKIIANEGVTHEQIESIAQDYDSVMSYPKEKTKMLLEEEKQHMEYQLAKERMRIEQQRLAQNQGYQGMGMSGLMGNKAIGGLY